MKKLVTILWLFGSIVSLGQDYRLVWSDEFDGTTLDLTKWKYNLGRGNNGWGNAELQSYTSSSKNISVANGILTMTAVQEQKDGAEFTSARILTQGLHSWKYGRFEARMKMPLGRGLWPAFWMLANNNQWPTTGEIDIMEYRGDRPKRTSGALHYGSRWPDNQWDGSHFDYSQNLSDDFHIYSVEWDENQIKWFFDSTLIKTERKDPNSLNPYPNHPNVWPWNNNFYLIHNLAVGGTFAGSPAIDQIELTKATFETDYIRVYTNDALPEPIVIEGKIEAEKYSRMQGITTEYSSDNGPAMNIGYLDAGDWVEYELNITENTDYDFIFRNASTVNTGKISMDLDGTQIVSSFDLPSTGGWHTWESNTLKNINLPSGLHTLRINIINGLFNLNYIDVRKNSLNSLFKEELQNISIYPTVFENQTEIKVLSPENSKLEIKAINQEGKEVFSSKDYFTNESFDFGSELNSGMYILYFIKDDKISFSKVIKL